MERIRSDFPSETVDRILSGINSTRVTSFRINRRMAAGTDPFLELEQAGVDFNRIDIVRDAAWVSLTERQKLLLSSAHEGKRIYIQNLASMLPAHFLQPLPGDRILDLAAAPGSKTLQIADAVDERTEVAAVELVRSRFFKMKSNLTANGVPFVKTFLKDGADVWKNRPEYFDKVLLDAPCASEGRFMTAEPKTLKFWSPKKAGEMARKQKRLLYSAIQATRPGGTIVYSTCSLSVEENENVVSRMLEKFGSALRTEELDLDVRERSPALGSWKGKSLNPGVANALRILPSARMEGFFICKLRKTASTLDQAGRRVDSYRVGTLKKDQSARRGFR